MSRAMWLALATAFVSMSAVFVLKTFADAVFLAEFGVSYLPHFYVAQAALVIAASYGYSALIRRGASVAATADAFMLLALLGAAVAAPSATSSGGLSVFATSLALITLSAVSQIGVWNSVTSVVSGRRSRSFLPKAGAAASAGAVLGSFASSGIAGALGLTGLVFAGSALVAITLVLRLLLLRTSRAWRRPQESRKSSTKHTTSSARKLIRVLAAATVVEALLSAFIDYGFKTELTWAFSSGEDIGVFLALFYGITNVLLLGLQIFASSRLLATRSLRFSLSLEPALLAVFGALWVMMPTLAIATLTRGSEGLLKFFIARPAQEVAMTPIPEIERNRYKVLLRGVFNQGGNALAGLLLIVAAPLLAEHDALLPIIAIALALCCLWLQNLAAKKYLDSLGSALGTRRLSRRDNREEQMLDRDGIARVLELIGSDDAAVAEFGREMLEEFASEPAVLEPHVGKGPAAMRIAIYQLLSRRPRRPCQAALRSAVPNEPLEPELFVPAMAALAAHRDGAAVERAVKICEDHEPDTDDAIGRAAWCYLAEVGDLDEDSETLQKVLRAELAIAGVRAARMFSAVLQRGSIDESVVDDSILEAMESDDPDRKRQGWRAAAIIGRSRTLTNLLKAIGETPAAAEEVAAHLDAAALDRIVLLSNAQGVPVRVRSRLLRALSVSDLPEVGDIAARGLLSDDEELRGLAAHSLLRRARDQGADVPQRTVEEALSRQLERFEVFVNARTGFATSSGRESAIEVNFRPGSLGDISAEALFIDELERVTERALSDLCGLLALLGKPNTVFAAQRAMRAHSFKRRRQGLDILQEVAKGKQRARLLALLDLYLLPPKKPTEQALQKACDVDPWLALCRSGGHGDLTPRLRALRSTALFDVIDGGSLVALAAHCTEVEFSEDDLIVREGEPGDALYVVIDGAVTITKDGQRVAQLGAGEAFGELALLDGQRRGASVVAAVDSKLLRLERDTFTNALAEHPEMGLGLLTGLTRLLRQASAAPHARRASLAMHVSDSGPSSSK